MVIVLFAVHLTDGIWDCNYHEYL